MRRQNKPGRQKRLLDASIEAVARHHRGLSQKHAGAFADIGAGNRGAPDIGIGQHRGQPRRLVPGQPRRAGMEIGPRRRLGAEIAMPPDSPFAQKGDVTPGRGFVLCSECPLLAQSGDAPFDMG